MSRCKCTIFRQHKTQVLNKLLVRSCCLQGSAVCRSYVVDVSYVQKVVERLTFMILLKHFSIMPARPSGNDRLEAGISS